MYISIYICLITYCIYRRRIYEIVRLHYTPLSDTAAYKSYRFDNKIIEINIDNS